LNSEPLREREVSDGVQNETDGRHYALEARDEERHQDRNRYGYRELQPAAGCQLREVQGCQYR
jgi:hypothetical protein